MSEYRRVNKKKYIVVYKLDAEYVKPGTLKVEISYRDAVLASQELTVE